MIELFQPPPGFNVPNPSPFCVKLEILLKMSGLPYEITIEGNPRNGPTGKIPYIKDGDKCMGDSGLIQNYLEEHYKIDFNKGLDDEQKAISLAFTRLIDEHLYWVLVYARWMEDENWKPLKKRFFGGLPFPMNILIARMARKDLAQSLHGHGIGRHSRTEIYAMGAADIKACADFLGDKDFAFGAEPTALDATLYGHIGGIIDPPFPSPLKDAALSHDNLIAYCQRMRARFFPDL